MKRDFEEWLSTFVDSIANYKYYIDFETVYNNANKYKVELNILNSLVGSKNIQTEFIELVSKYPNVLKCVPVLLAVRQYEIVVLDNGTRFVYNFNSLNYNVEQYVKFMNETGLFDLISNHVINNLYDYVLGVETGLNSNARKNRGGTLMEDLAENYIKSAGLKKGIDYFTQMNLQEIEENWKLDMSFMSNNNQATKVFDFVIKTDSCIYGIETNFYASGGSKLNETAKSYKLLAEESKNIVGFKFVWITDGLGWIGAKRNLKETFDVMEHIYNINDMKNEIIKKIIKR